jgi:chromosomal replication initiator protein
MATIGEIKGFVAVHYKVSMEALESDFQYRRLLLPRQVAMYLCHKVSGFSVEETGKAFGDRSSGMVLYAIEKIENNIKTKPRIKADIKKLTEMIST